MISERIDSGPETAPIVRILLDITQKGRRGFVSLREIASVHQCADGISDEVQGEGSLVLGRA